MAVTRSDDGARRDAVPARAVGRYAVVFFSTVSGDRAASPEQALGEALAVLGEVGCAENKWTVYDLEYGDTFVLTQADAVDTGGSRVVVALLS